MAKFTKENLVSGMFGKLNDGDVFVVVGDKLIYDGGQYDDIVGMDDNLVFRNSKRYITELYEVRCFGQVKDGRAKAIWKREDEEPEEEATTPEVPEVPEGAITITEEQFFDAISKANDHFMEVAKATPGEEAVTALMGIQNIAFGTLIGMVLFNKEIK